MLRKTSTKKETAKPALLVNSSCVYISCLDTSVKVNKQAMPFNRAWLVLPSKRVKKQKTPNQKSFQHDSFKTRRNKSVLSKSECFCENTSELQFAHSVKSHKYKNNRNIQK